MALVGENSERGGPSILISRISSKVVVRRIVRFVVLISSKEEKNNLLNSSIRKGQTKDQFT